MNKIIEEYIGKSEKVLVGIGEYYDGKENSGEAYAILAKYLEGKDYFVVTLCEDGVIAESGLRSERITNPVCEDVSNWDEYNAWLTKTLNKSLLVLELGVGLAYPNVVRWPFEKVAFVNNKAKMIRVHKSLYQTTDELGEKCIPMKADPINIIIEE